MSVAREDKEKSPEILVVDDDDDLVEIIETALEHCNLRYRRARDGQEALYEVERARPELVLLDMKLPVMNGWEFARRLYDRYGRTIPVVVMTAAEDSELRANEIGADSYIGKPFNVSELCRVVRSTLPREEPINAP